MAIVSQCRDVGFSAFSEPPRLRAGLSFPALCAQGCGSPSACVPRHPPKQTPGASLGAPHKQAENKKSSSSIRKFANAAAAL